MINICKVALQYCVIRGINVSRVTHAIRIFESMCKPYRTAEIVLLNGDSQINELQLKVGDEAEFMIMDSQGKTYQMISYVTAIPEMFSTDKLREDMVTVATVTNEFMRDRANMVQGSYADMPATSAASIIHNQYISTPLQMGAPSAGPIAKGSEIGGHLVQNQKPFTAIRKILDLANPGGFKTGSYVYFANKIAMRMAPLEQLMVQGPVFDLIQKDTWGISGGHMFGAQDAWKSVLGSKLYHKEASPEAAGAGAAVKAGVQMKNVFDRKIRFPIAEQFAAKVLNPVAAPFMATGGALGGRELSKVFTDEAKFPNATSPHIKEPAEADYKAKVRDGTNFLVKCTIEAGFMPQFTVGNRVHVSLMAPLTNEYNVIEDDLLVADCMHEAYFDQRIVSGTTTIRGVKAPT